MSNFCQITYINQIDLVNVVIRCLFTFFCDLPVLTFRIFRNRLRTKGLVFLGIHTHTHAKCTQNHATFAFAHESNAKLEPHQKEMAKKAILLIGLTLITKSNGNKQWKRLSIEKLFYKPFVYGSHLINLVTSFLCLRSRNRWRSILRATAKVNVRYEQLKRIRPDRHTFKQ